MSLLFSFDFANPVQTEKVLEVHGGQGAFSFDVVSKNLDAADSVVSFFYSNNNVDFMPIPIGLNNVEFTLPIGNDLNIFNVSQVDHVFYKVVVSAGSTTVGTIEIYTKQ